MFLWNTTRATRLFFFFFSSRRRHTRFSRDWSSDVCSSDLTDLDVIAITDHDETRASIEAREYADQRGYRVKVVAGVEVTTRDGHLLALFVEQRPAALMSIQATAEWVRERAGLCIAPHPFTRWTHSLSSRALLAAHEHQLLAGIE